MMTMITRKASIRFLALLIFGGVWGAVALNAWPLTPDEVLVVVNGRHREGLDLAGHYMTKRHIPMQNRIVVDMPTGETCRYTDFHEKLVIPIRRYLAAGKDPRSRIRCLVLMYGLPMRIHVTEADIKQMKNGLARSSKFQPGRSTLKDASASVDSELMLVKTPNYPLEGWIPNPYFIGFQRSSNKKARAHAIGKNGVVMVSRLDGPSPEIVRRIIDDSVAVEALGLSGTAYFDARWPFPKEKASSGYAKYDKSIHQAAGLVKASKRMPVVLDDGEALFQPGQCPDAALYCGWYQLADYVDAFSWRPGAIGYHIASGECKTLKKAESRVWCKMMLEKGVAATLGPVEEPYVNAFPVPHIFFGFLVDGYLTLAECYLLSIPFISWKMVLVGDPLYRPFQPLIRNE